MLRLILSIFVLIASLVNFFPVPAKQLWYPAIAVSEYPAISMLVCLLLIVWNARKAKFRVPALIISIVAFAMLSRPIAGAVKISNNIETDMTAAFGAAEEKAPLFPTTPYRFAKMFSSTGAKEIPFQTFEFAKPGGVSLTLNFSGSAVPGVRPCVVEVHGGSWAKGDNSELANFNNYLANAGYHVATINYRLAPKYTSPSQEEDIKSALLWLNANAQRLAIDTNKYVLTGRSAGGHLVLSAAYKKLVPGIVGVAAFYGPVDMFWTWEHPDMPLIMDSRKVQSDFLGGDPQSKRDRYQAESPLFYANPNSVPTLLVHGENDAHVWHEQSVMMQKKLDELKVPNYFLSLPWATHGCEYNLNGPSGQLVCYAMQHFLERVTR